jgi:osmotically-inducible protein OsmY
VKDGVVTLAGTPGSVILGRNVADQARHVEGVIAVRDRFTYPAPASQAASQAASDPGL